MAKAVNLDQLFDWRHIHSLSWIFFSFYQKPMSEAYQFIRDVRSIIDNRVELRYKRHKIGLPSKRNLKIIIPANRSITEKKPGSLTVENSIIFRPNRLELS